MPRFECEECGIPFLMELSLTVHLRQFHGDGDEGPVDETKRCTHPGCDAVFLTDHGLEHHARSHDPVPPAPCGEPLPTDWPCTVDGCERTFGSLHGRKLHETKAHDEVAKARREEKRRVREQADADRRRRRAAEKAERDRKFAESRLGPGADPYDIAALGPIAPRSWEPPDPRLPFAAKHEPFLGCTEPGCPWYTTSIPALTCHTVEQHGRQPTRDDRTPIVDDDEKQRRIAECAHAARPVLAL